VVKKTAGKARGICELICDFKIRILGKVASVFFALVFGFAVDKKIEK
jgi:hypothetical protein